MEQFHGGDCVGLAEIDHPVSVIVPLRRQKAVFTSGLLITPLLNHWRAAEKVPRVAVDNGARWVGLAGLFGASYGSSPKGNVVCERR